MTFSIVARCAESGAFGVAIASSSPAVAARCAHGAAAVGAVASQNVTDPTLGPAALALMANGATAAEAVAILVRTRPHMAHRQLLAVDARGETAIHTGAAALGVAGEARGPDAACGGNLLAHPEVPVAMLAGFRAAEGPFGDRLLAALAAGRDAGGEAGPARSAGLRIFRDALFPYADLRVDWTEEGACPIAALAGIWAVYAPQAEAYVIRARDPEAAPSYGVPGDP